MNTNLTELLIELRKPFNPSVVTWKPGAVSKEGTSALGMAYADVRAYQDRLDEVCGMDWSVSYTPWGDRVICHVTIDGVTRSSTGEPDAQSERSEIAGTATEAQAFKRACAMFGLGRYLYNLPSVWADYNKEQRRFTDKGLAKLEGIIAGHYRQAMEAQPTTAGHHNAIVGSSAENKSPAEPLQYAAIADGLTGNCAALAQWAAKLHIGGSGPASSKQYEFLVGTIDQATGGAHTAVLSVLCRRHIHGEDPCSKELAGKLLDFILPKADGKDNPKYRPDYVECLRSIAQVANGQLTLVTA